MQYLNQLTSDNRGVWTDIEGDVDSMMIGLSMTGGRMARGCGLL